LKELFEQRDATKPGSKEEDQAVDRIMEAVFPEMNMTMAVEDARALIARADAAEGVGVPMTEENMRALGYVKTEGGVWELPIPVPVLRRL
jgi:hypothetical protein